MMQLIIIRLNVPRDTVHCYHVTLVT